MADRTCETCGAQDVCVFSLEMCTDCGEGLPYWRGDDSALIASMEAHGSELERTLLEWREQAAAVSAVVDVARALTDRMQRIYDSPEYQGVWQLAQIHCGQYRGESWEAEFDALRAALAALEVDRG